MPKIQFKRGQEANLPVLAEGEPGFTTDSEKLFIGSAVGNVEVAKKEHVDEVQTDLQGQIDSHTDQISQTNSRFDDLQKVDANAEVLAARGTYALLKDRFAANESSLAQNVQQIEDFAVSIDIFPIQIPEVDDTARIQRTIDYVSSAYNYGTIYFPKGLYTCSGQLTLKKGVNLKGTGFQSFSEINFESRSCAMIKYTGGNTLFAFDASAVYNNTIEGIAFHGNNTALSMINITNPNGILTIKENYFVYCKKGIIVDDTVSHLISHNHFKKCETGVDLTVRGNGCQVVYNLFDDCTKYGIEVSANGAIILGNSIDHGCYGSSAILVKTNFGGSNKNIIALNRIELTRTAAEAIQYGITIMDGALNTMCIGNAIYTQVDTVDVITYHYNDLSKKAQIYDSDFSTMQGMSRVFTGNAAVDTNSEWIGSPTTGDFNILTRSKQAFIADTNNNDPAGTVQFAFKTGAISYGSAQEILLLYKSKITQFGHSISYGSAPPTTGTYVNGDIVYNTAPLPGGYVGWVCTNTGAPGTWKGFGLIQV
jgi:hypothetical protein